MADIRRILSKEQWEKIELDYKAGNWKSVSELAERNGLKVDTLLKAAKRNGWKDEREQYRLKLSERVQEKAINEVDSWLSRVKSRTLKDWEIIDKSTDNIGSSSGEVDPETLLPYIRGRKLLDDMHRRALGLSDPTNHVDIKSGGLSLSESLISAIAKVRDSQSEPKLTDSELDRIIEAEVIEDV